MAPKVRSLRKRKGRAEPTLSWDRRQWAALAYDLSELDRYENPERLVDEGYDSWQKSLSVVSRFTGLSHDGPLIRRGLGEGFMYRLSYEYGGKRLLRDFFLMVEENLSGESSLSCLTRTPWLSPMLTSIALRIQRKMPLQKTPYSVSIRNGGAVMKGLVLHDAKNANVLTLRFTTEEETDGRGTGTGQEG